MTTRLPDGQPDLTEWFADRLEAYRVSYEATRNGCWAWMAINLCWGGKWGEDYRGEISWNPTPRPELPDWVKNYLMEGAEFIYNVGMPNGPLLRRGDEAANSAAPQAMLKTLKLVGEKKGENWFRDFANDMRASQSAFLAHLGNEEHAFEVAKRRDVGVTRSKSKKAVRRGRERFPYLARSSLQEDTEK